MSKKRQKRINFKKGIIYLLAYIGLEFILYKALLYIVFNCITTLR